MRQRPMPSEGGTVPETLRPFHPHGVATSMHTVGWGTLLVGGQGEILARNDEFDEIWGSIEGISTIKEERTLFSRLAEKAANPAAFLAPVREGELDPHARFSDTRHLTDGRIVHRTMQPLVTRGPPRRVWSFIDVTDLHEHIGPPPTTEQDLFDALPVGIYKTTPEGQILYVNQTLVDMLGAESPDDLQGQNVQDSANVPRPSYPRESFLSELDEAGEVRGLRKRWTLPNGDTLLIRESARAIEDDAGNVLYYQGVIEDITETFDTKQRLRAHQNRLTTLLNKAPVLLVVLDESGVITDIEGTGLERFGFSPSDLLGQDTTSLPLNEDARDAIQRALDGTPTTSELRLQDRWLHIQLVPAKHDANTQDALIGVITDITPRKTLEQDLREERQRLHEAQRVARLGSWDWDIPNDAVSRSPEQLRLLGIGPHDAPEDGIQTYLNRVHPDDRERVATLLEQALQERTFPTYEHRIQHPDGTIRWVECRGKTLIEDGRVKRITGTCLDITERKRAREKVQRLNATLEERIRERTAELRAVNQELRTFTYGVSHDLRGPQHTIHGYAQILLDDHADDLPPQARHQLERIQDAAKKSVQRMDALLGLARVTQRPLHPKRIDVTKTANRIIEPLQTQDPQRDVTTHVAERITVQADPKLFEILLENLIQNAWKFTQDQPDPHILIDQEPDRKGAWVLVEDNGIGLDPDRADTLFKPFQQAHDGRFEGTGIGLTLAQRVIERHGGEIQATTNPQGGATIRFKLDGA